MKRSSTGATAAFLMLVIFSNVAAAVPRQPVAVVSTLSGDVTVGRAGGSIPLKFKDEIFPDDAIKTADQSIVRLLLREKALMTVQQRSLLTLRDEQGTSMVALEAGQIGVSMADRQQRVGGTLQVQTPNVKAVLGPGNIIINTSKISGRLQTTVYVVDGSVEISVPGTGTQRTVKIEAPRKLTVTGKALGSPRPLSAAESTQLLAQLRVTSSQHVAAPSEIERVIVQHGRIEAAKQAKLVAKQVKQAETNRTAEKGAGLEGGPKAGLDSVSSDIGARGVSTIDNKVAVGVTNSQPIERLVPAGSLPKGPPVLSNQSLFTNKSAITIQSVNPKVAP